MENTGINLGEVKLANPDHFHLLTVLVFGLQ